MVACAFFLSKIWDWVPTEISSPYQVLSSYPLWCIIKGMFQSNGAKGNIIPFYPHTLLWGFGLFFLGLLHSRGRMGFLILKIE